MQTEAHKAVVIMLSTVEEILQKMEEQLRVLEATENLDVHNYERILALWIKWTLIAQGWFPTLLVKVFQPVYVLHRWGVLMAGR